MARKYTARAVAEMRDEIQSMCEQIVELGRNGASAKMLCLSLNLSAEEINQLREKSTDFDAAFNKSQDLAQGFHEAKMIESIGDKSLNSQLYATFLRGAFSGSYESAAYKVAEKKSDAGKQGETIDFQGEINALLKSLREAG